MQARSGVAIAALLVAGVVPAAVADAVFLEVVGEDGVPRMFARSDVVVFRVTVAANEPRDFDHRIYVYRGPDTTGSNLVVVDDGGVTHADPHRAMSFRVPWDQTMPGGWVGPGTYTAQYRPPGRPYVTARFDVELGPDFEVTYVGTRDVELVPGPPSPQKNVLGCVRNVGYLAAETVAVTVSSRSALASTFVPQLTQNVRLGNPALCPWVAGGGTPFQVPFNAAAAPGGAFLREVEAEANADRTVWEPSYVNNARTAPARWLD